VVHHASCKETSHERKNFYRIILRGEQVEKGFVIRTERGKYWQGHDAKNYDGSIHSAKVFPEDEYNRALYYSDDDETVVAVNVQPRVVTLSRRKINAEQK
jgi:hypothetical protein